MVVVWMKIPHYLADGALDWMLVAHHRHFLLNVCFKIQTNCNKNVFGIHSSVITVGVVLVLFISSSPFRKIYISPFESLVAAKSEIFNRGRIFLPLRPKYSIMSTNIFFKGVCFIFFKQQLIQIIIGKADKPIISLIMLLVSASISTILQQKQWQNNYKPNS